jgi:hypothetical protein
MQEQQTPPPPLNLNRFDYFVLGLIAIGFAFGTLFVLLSYLEFQRLFAEYHRFRYEWDSDTRTIYFAFRPFDDLLFPLSFVFIGLLCLMRWCYLKLQAVSIDL